MCNFCLLYTSNLKFTVNHDGDIRFGLGAVKGVGEAAVQSIMEERRKNGPFLGIFDFVQRVNLNACNKKNMECLALAGGFDSFPELKREQYFAVNSKGCLLYTSTACADVIKLRF